MAHCFKSSFTLKLIPLLLGVLLSACDDPNNQAKTSRPTPPIVEKEPTGYPVDTNQRVLEPLKKDLRVIGDGKIAAPIVEADKVERVAPEISAAEKNATQTAKIPEEPDIFPKPLVLSAGEFKSKEIVVSLLGIEPLARTKTCSSAQGEWPCGNFAKSALQRLVRSRTISCEGEVVGSGKYSGKCQIGKTDLAKWLVEQGWATTKNAELLPMLEKAKRAKKGLWRD
ncbi:MAG: thermonuclease family protein [Salaquimonas sp.]